MMLLGTAILAAFCGTVVFLCIYAGFYASKVRHLEREMERMRSAEDVYTDNAVFYGSEPNNGGWL